jgi:hypothetical protein
MKAILSVFAVLALGFGGVFSVAANLPEYKEATRIAEELSVKQQAVNSRTAARQMIVKEVIDGNITLPQAADKFGALQGYDAATVQSIQKTLMVDSARELHCQQVLLWIKAELADTEEADTIVPRLEKELNEYLSEQHHGV